uniref:Uncharacterized protein n=1 Tax=Strongyloides stercoralis TaxID=6248 RepID=A0A0K0EJ24_STRER
MKKRSIQNRKKNYDMEINVDKLFGMKKRSIQNRKKNYDMEINVDKCTLGNTQVPNKKKNLTKSYYESIPFAKKK